MNECNNVNKLLHDLNMIKYRCGVKLMMLIAKFNAVGIFLIKNDDIKKYSVKDRQTILKRRSVLFVFASL